MVYHWHRPIFWRPGDLSWILGSQICLSESIRAQSQPRWCAILRVAWPVDSSIRRFFPCGDVSQVGSLGCLGCLGRPRGCPASLEALGSLRPAKARPQWTFWTPKTYENILSKRDLKTFDVKMTDYLRRYFHFTCLGTKNPAETESRVFHMAQALRQFAWRAHAAESWFASASAVACSYGMLTCSWQFHKMSKTMSETFRQHIWHIETILIRMQRQTLYPS